MNYKLELTQEAERQLLLWNKSGAKKELKKIVSLFAEMKVHPTIGTGQVERLKADLTGCWSRRINKQDRLVYTIDEEKKEIVILSMMGHYGEK